MHFPRNAGTLWSTARTEVKNMFLMRFCGVSVLVLAFFGGACTVPNPRSCGDGVCSDQQFPFCDINGTLGGEPNECVAVACQPGKVAECRGDIAVTCNASGNNFDLSTCQGSCDIASGGCVECVSSSECQSSEPVCDVATRMCRGCTSDSECSSGVCQMDSGVCYDASQVIYAHPDGSGLTPCAMNDPCPAYYALTTALQQPMPPPIRLLPGIYRDAISVATDDNKSVIFTGAGASLVGDVIIAGEVRVKFRDLILRSNITCGNNSIKRSRLDLDRVTYLSQHSGVQIYHCSADISDSKFRGLPSSGLRLIYVYDDGALTIDRSRFDIAGGLFNVQASGRRMRVRVTNSVLKGGLSVKGYDASASGSQSTFQFGFNTFIDPNVWCYNPEGGRYSMLFENNIFYSSGTMAPDFGSGMFNSVCTFNTNVFSLAQPYGGTNINADPMLTNPAEDDFAPLFASPAIDAAIPSVQLPATKDVRGVTRPQGGKPDIGAFERTP